MNFTNNYLKKKTETWVGWISQHIFKGRQKPIASVDTAKAHASIDGCVSRQPFFLAIIFLLEFAVREDIKKAGAHVTAKIMQISETTK